MTTAHQEPISAGPRDLAAAAIAREKAKEYIEEFQRENPGELPSGQQVADEVGHGMTDKWGRNQLKPFRPADDTSPAGTPAPRRPGTVRELVAERSAPAPAAEAATAHIVPPAPVRPMPSPAPRPERTAERPTGPAPTSTERSGTSKPLVSGTPTGTPAVPAGTPAAAPAPAGTPAAPSSRREKVAEFVEMLPLYLIALGAFVSIWGGWVGLGKLTGFGEIELLPGIVGWKLDTAITLPLGMEAYAAYALRVWLAPPAGMSDFGKKFAARSTIAALVLGAAGQIAYHLMEEAGLTSAPWLITAFVACLPVGVLGCGAALTHLVRHAKRVQP